MSRVAAGTRTSAGSRVNAGERTLITPPRPLTINPLTEGPTWIHAGWAEDPAWTSRPADGVGVRTWRNVGSPNLTQTTGANQPTFRRSTSVLNGRSSLEFVPASSTVIHADITDIPGNADPGYYIVAIAYGTNWGTSVPLERFFSGGGASTATGIGLNAPGDAWNLRMDTLLVQSGGTVATPGPHLIVAHITGGGPNSWLDVSGVRKINAAQTGVALKRIVLGAGSSNVPAFANYFTGYIHFWGVTTSDPTIHANWPIIRQLAWACGAVSA